MTPPNHGSLSQTLTLRFLIWEGDHLSPSYYSFDSVYKAWDPLVWTQGRGNVYINSGHPVLRTKA